MHPLWQIKQVIKINGKYTVDWCNNYGNRAAGDLWGAFFALEIWIAIYVKLITDLFVLRSTAVPDNMESSFGLVSSSHKPLHLTHTCQPKVNTCGFSGTHFIVQRPEADLVICYSTSD
jgi:hypothetical protein